MKTDIRMKQTKGMCNIRPAGKWDEAYPSGNGTMGVLAMGEPLHETLIFNHEKSFLPLPENTASEIPDMSDVLPELRRMLKAGEYARGTDFWLDSLFGRGFPSELIWTDPFHPAMDLVIDMESGGDIENYIRWINFETGETGVKWQDQRGAVARRMFVSRRCGAVVLELRAPSREKLNCSIRITEHPGSNYIKSTNIRCMACPEEKARNRRANASIVDYAAVGKPDIENSYDARMMFQSLYEVGDGGYDGVVLIHQTGGRTVCQDKDTIAIRDAQKALLLVRIVPFQNRTQSDQEAVIRELACIPAEYDRLLEDHVRIHGELFNRVRLELSDQTMPASEAELSDRSLPTTESELSNPPHSCAQPKPPVEPETSINCKDSSSGCCPGVEDPFPGDSRADFLPSNEELLTEAKNGRIPPEFFVRMHDFGRYLLISSSGQLPPNLQGVWNGTWNPPWSSDYTLDENIQMMMWQVLPGNLSELAWSYFNLIESYIEDWKTNAKLYYGCRGVLSSARSSTKGLHKHLSRDYPLVFWTAGAGWLAQMFFDYWQFTQDRVFLEKHAVPLLKEIAAFYEDFLTEGENGRLEFAPSYSPENTPSNSDSPATINATMDIAVAKEVLTNLITACEQLGTEQQNLPKWRRMLERLPDYMINKDGAIQEWSWPGLEDNYHHRHSSHLYPVFPGFEVGREETPELYQACLKAAQLRLADGIEAITGWGLAHLANISARLKDRDLCHKALRRIIQKFLLPNLFTCHNEGELFQMDANLGFSAAILEMLVFSKPGWIELFPALPQEISKGCISGVCCRGQITLSYLQWDMTEGLICVELKSGRNQTVTLKLPYETERIELSIQSPAESEILHSSATASAGPTAAPAIGTPEGRRSDDLHIISGQGSDIIKLNLAKEYAVRLTIQLKHPD